MPDRAHIASSAREAANAQTLGALVYRSLAGPGLDTRRLGEMLATARARNAAEGLTGLLLYDGIHFFQWLEGPVEAVQRVWASIKADQRHSEIQLISMPRLPVRVFRGWDMGLAGASRSIAEGVDDVVLVDQPYLEKLTTASGSLGTILDLLARVAPVDTALAAARAENERSDHVRLICLDHVLPLVQAQHGLDVGLPRHMAGPGSTLPRIDRLFIERFADHLRGSEHGATGRVWDRLLGLGVSADSLCADLVEPTARRLGDLWADDICSGADLTIAVSELLLLLRQGMQPAAPRARPGQARVLITSPPGSFNALGPALVARRLDALHLYTDCLYPESDEELDARLLDHDYETLLIALDPIHARSMNIQMLDDTVREARAATHNRRLRIMLYGRQVSAEPGIASRIRSDSAYATLAELNAAAMEWERS